MAMEAAQKFISLLELTSELYSPELFQGALPADLVEDEIVLRDWVVSTSTMEAFSQSLSGDGLREAIPDENDVTVVSCQRMLAIIDRRFKASKDPAKAVDQFDFGAEKKRRLRVRHQMSEMTNAILSFYQSLGERLDSQDVPVSTEMPEETEASMVNESSDIEQDTAPIYAPPEDDLTLPAVNADPTLTTSSAVDEPSNANKINEYESEKTEAEKDIDNELSEAPKRTEPKDLSEEQIEAQIHDAFAWVDAQEG